MQFEFSSQATIHEDWDPLLVETLAGCYIECDITLECESNDGEVSLNGVNVDDVKFIPPDSLEAIRAQLFMGSELMDAIKKAAEERVKSEWADYANQAEEAFRAKMEERLDEYNDGSW